MKRIVEVRLCSLVDAGTDCVVNASNDSAKLGGGASRALFEECGGSVLQDEMTRKLEEEFDGVLEEGDCLVTSAGTSTKFRHILHVPAVNYRGPKAVFGADGRPARTVTSPERLVACSCAALHAAMDIAEKEGRPVSVTFPLLGAGSGGVPPRSSCHAILDGLREVFAGAPEAAIARVVFAVPEADRFTVCEQLLKAWIGA